MSRRWKTTRKSLIRGCLLTMLLLVVTAVVVAHHPHRASAYNNAHASVNLQPEQMPTETRSKAQQSLASARGTEHILLAQPAAARGAVTDAGADADHSDMRRAESGLLLTQTQAAPPAHNESANTRGTIASLKPASPSQSTSAAAAAAEVGSGEKTTSPPIQKFKVFTGQWLDESEDIAEDFMSTPAMIRLAAGHFGDIDLTVLGVDGVKAVKRGVHATLSRCLHTLNLFKTIKLFHDGVIPARETLPGCGHRKLRLLFMLDRIVDLAKTRQVFSESRSVNVRMLPFASALAQRGHTALISDVEHLNQINLATLDGIVFVKELSPGFQRLQNSTVPLIWDHLDEWNDFPFWNVGQWKHKHAFAGVITSGRIAKVAFDKAGIPAQVVYHNHANFANLHRANRTSDVELVALQGTHKPDNDLFLKLKAYCKDHQLRFRSGYHTGFSWGVKELAASLAHRSAGYDAQTGWHMGFEDVDIAVLWPQDYNQYHICYKPTSRLAQMASLGIPIVTYPFASYIDVLVEFGYPLVAESPDEVTEMVGMLIGSPTLRQQASTLLLEIAKFLSVKELSERYEQAICQFLSSENLSLRGSSRSTAV